VTPRNGRKRPLALGYIRVSTIEQSVEGASLESQRFVLGQEAGRRGWDLEVVADEGMSAKNLNRPGLTSALVRLDAGDADALMAVRLDRVSRSVADFAGLLARARKQQWRVVLLSPDLDTEDPASKFTAHVLAAAAEYERDLIGVRTREGMAQRRAEGVHVGRPRVLPEAITDRILSERQSGSTLKSIADGLNADGVPTARGGSTWGVSSVHAVIRSRTPRAVS